MWKRAVAWLESMALGALFAAPKYFAVAVVFSVPQLGGLCLAATTVLFILYCICVLPPTLFAWFTRQPVLTARDAVETWGRINFPATGVSIPMSAVMSVEHGDAPGHVTLVTRSGAFPAIMATETPKGR